MSESATSFRYKRPPIFIAKVANPMLNLLVKAGLKPGGAGTVTVRGRKTGKAISTPVNPLQYEGTTYLVAPRGDTHWARNLRVAGSGALRVGRSTSRFEAEEVPPPERAPILRAYLDRWGRVTKSQFEVRGDETVEELQAIAERHPVFRITTR